MTGPVTSISASVSASTTPITTSCAKNCTEPKGTALNASRMVAIAPGPAIIGKANGNTEMSPR